MSDDDSLLELWDEIEGQIDAWRESVDEEEASALLSFLKGNQLDDIKKDNGFDCIEQMCLNGADTVEELVYALAGELHELEQVQERWLLLTGAHDERPVLAWSDDIVAIHWIAEGRTKIIFFGGNYVIVKENIGDVANALGIKHTFNVGDAK